MFAIAKATEEEYEQLQQLGAMIKTISQNMDKLIMHQMAINMQISQFWRDIGKKYDLDTTHVPYTITESRDIIMVGMVEQNNVLQ